MFGRGVQISKVTSAAAGYSNLLSDGVISFQNQHGTSVRSGFDGAHEGCGAGPHNNDVSRFRTQVRLRAPLLQPYARTIASTLPYIRPRQSPASARRTKEVHEQCMRQSALRANRRWPTP